MKIIKPVIAVLLFMAAVCTLYADQKWMTSAEVEISQPGLVEALLIPELHRSLSRSVPNQLDLSLRGPDGNLRPFELFWRTSGDSERVTIEPDSVEVTEEPGLVWSANLPAGNVYHQIHIQIEQGSYAGKVAVECRINGEWKTIAAALPLEGAKGSLDWKLDGLSYDRVRLTFKGYDISFKNTPVFVKRVEVTGSKPGRNQTSVDYQVPFETNVVDGGIEIRVLLPGSGIRIESLNIKSSALFKGRWQVGKERIALGAKDFEIFTKGESAAVAVESGSLDIPVNSTWDSRVALIRMTSDEYFGEIEKVIIRAALPVMLFNADMAGSFTAFTGAEKKAVILERPAAEIVTSPFFAAFRNVQNNPDWQAESLLQGYSIKGGPFQAEGYTWTAEFKVDSPGFYQLECNEEVCLDRYRNSLRIIRDNTQIPYFMGRQELRELQIAVEHDYDSAQNRSMYLIKLPQGAARISSVQLRAKGVFERTLIFEKHVAGQISWQPWQKRRWAGNNDKEAIFTLPLFDFPEDQYEVRLIVEHGNNQPLEITGFKGLYSAQDLFFVALEAGDYKLTGGNPSARPPVYDLAIVQNQLVELSPQKIKHGQLEKNQILDDERLKAVDQGAPFNDSGYNWVASFSVGAGGLYQLKLNKQASLDNNRQGFRLVKNGLQVPYFWGETSVEQSDLAFSTEYDQKNNTSICLIRLPAYSRNWRSVNLVSTGIFMRDVSAEIRKPGKLGWQSFSRHQWVSKTDGETRLSIGLERLPEGETEIRVVVPHGDNRSIEILKVQGEYQTQAMLFMAGETGEYLLYGGNSRARAPVYDLALIRNSLLKTEPMRIALDDISSFSGSSDIQKHIQHTFSETEWGLYLILGLVTLLLVVLIVKLFPEEDTPAASGKNDDKDNEK